MNFQRRRIARVGAAAALLGVAGAAARRPARAQSADERAVAQAVEALTRALIDVDRARLQALSPTS